MGGDVLIEFRGDHVLVLHPRDYELTPDTARKVWQGIGAACAEHSCTKVLAQGFISRRRLTLTDAFHSGLAAAQEIPGLQLALCLEGHVADDMTEFFQKVASNRGVRIEVFTNVEAAREWLGIAG